MQVWTVFVRTSFLLFNFTESDGNNCFYSNATIFENEKVFKSFSKRVCGIFHRLTAFAREFGQSCRHTQGPTISANYFEQFLGCLCCFQIALASPVAASLNFMSSTLTFVRSTFGPFGVGAALTRGSQDLQTTLTANHNVKRCLGIDWCAIDQGTCVFKSPK